MRRDLRCCSTGLSGRVSHPACEAAGRCRLRSEDFAGACGARLYRLMMAIRPDALPTDPAALTEMVLALDAENEKLRWRCRHSGR
ncbi:protein of unknown function [Bradyrhizobium vignae]|uniref:Uncharacterized protein n=1 Tax=Bradyrhizobium vignae TaxID=1549949 RepID=A0A2U3Q9V5_9BRAD|nr:protein of unknown function [Bradyrhizobium vignae]